MISGGSFNRTLARRSPYRASIFHRRKRDSRAWRGRLVSDHLRAESSRFRLNAVCDVGFSWTAAPQCIQTSRVLDDVTMSSEFLNKEISYSCFTEMWKRLLLFRNGEEVNEVLVCGFCCNANWAVNGIKLSTRANLFGMESWNNAPVVMVWRIQLETLSRPQFLKYAFL